MGGYEGAVQSRKTFFNTRSTGGTSGLPRGRIALIPSHDDTTTPQTAERPSASIIPRNMDKPFDEPTRAHAPLLLQSIGSADGHTAEAERRGYAYEGPFSDYQSPEHGAFGCFDASEAVRAPPQHKGLRDSIRRGNDRGWCGMKWRV